MSNNFVDLFCELTKNFESPHSFWRWSAYGAIAATLRFNCYLKWGTSFLYPNVYILLLADSAAYRKDAGPELVEELLRECSHTKVISGRASYQGIVDELSQDIGYKKTGIPIKQGAAILIAKEFTAFFVDDPNLINLLTEGYSFAEEYEYTLRGGKTKVKKRCISILGGSNETLLRDVFTVKASNGGLLRRTFLISPDKRRPPNALTEDADNLNSKDKKFLVDELKKIAVLNGEFKRNEEAKQFYKDWYVDLYNNYDKLDDRSGFIQGLHSMVMKLSMILAAAEESLIITEKNILQATEEVMALKENYLTYTMGVGRNPQADIGAVILMELWKCSNNGHPMIKRRDLVFKYWHQISSEELDKLIQTLESGNIIHMVPTGNEPSYELTEKGKEIFLKHVQKGIN